MKLFFLSLKTSTAFKISHYPFICHGWPHAVVQNKKLSFLESSPLIFLFCISLSSCALGPDPITLHEHDQEVKSRLVELNQTPKPTTKTISLSEAVARAVRYNWATRVQAYQAVLENTQIDLANTAMLPDLLSNAGYRFRNPEYASQNPEKTSLLYS